jgi:hypothetical protein
MRAIFCGDREWKDYYAIKGEMEKLPKRTVIIQGRCRGADRLAKKAADSLGLTCRGYTANWPKYRNGAGPVRNTLMLHKERPKLVVAFHDNLWDGSVGTLDMVRKAIAIGVKVNLYSNGTLQEDI